ncbi:phage portal protein [Nocardioides ochotonae]|uniref:phage portal protein n=1 Tax=Nocardioides ochotonae TaxID=2685869 RepID=UPI00140D0C32|nr:phage portal protein [Nocardioides ochotonae]
MAVAIDLSTLRLTDDEADLIAEHLHTLARLRMGNLMRAAYYDGRQRVRHLGIAIPPALRNIEVVVGWPGTAVDALEERLDFQGWTSTSGGDLFGLDEIFEDNGLAIDGALGHLDALIYGASFVILGAAYDDEPSPLITVESPLRVTGEWSGRLRRLTSAVSIDEVTDAGDPQTITLYRPDYNVTATYRSGVWHVEDTEGRPGRDPHRLGRVQVVPLVNRPRASRPWGRSEITRAVRSTTDQAVRTLLGMEVNREFYSAPQRYALGADESSFADADGNLRTGWELVMGRMLALPRDEDGELPQVGEFNAASPAPYLEQVRGLAQLLAAEAAIPATYLGFISDNPASADAIRAAEARLIKRAERRQVTFGRAWREVARLALLIREGHVPDGFNEVGVKWRDAATPTRAAAADEAVKLVAADILPADSEVTYDRLGLTPLEKRVLAADKRRARPAVTVAAPVAPTPAQAGLEDTDDDADPAA